MPQIQPNATNSTPLSQPKPQLLDALNPMRTRTKFQHLEHRLLSRTQTSRTQMCQVECRCIKANAAQYVDSNTQQVALSMDVSSRRRFVRGSRIQVRLEGRGGLHEGTPTQCVQTPSLLLPLTSECPEEPNIAPMPRTQWNTTQRRHVESNTQQVVCVRVSRMRMC